MVRIPTCGTADFVRSCVEQDLKALETDYVDLMLIHFPMGSCAETWSVLEDYHAKGTLKAIGVSNFNKSHLEHLIDGMSYCE